MIDGLEAFVRHGAGDFSSIALALFADQREKNPDYAAFCGDAAPTSWQEIPAVPVALFRDLALTAFPPEEAQHTFRTSGTTGRRGVHRVKDTALYDLGARLWAERCVGPIPQQGISLVTHSAESSLGHMCQAFCPSLVPFFDPSRGVDVEGAWAALAAADAPVFVPGTAFAFADLLAGSDAICPLPAGSIVMVTGGFKGRRRSMPAEDLYAALRHRLPGARRVGEYGMTELSSQLWSVPLGGAFQAPPWMKVLAVDPWTGAPAERGLLRFFDLANHQTVLAIETRDLGAVYAHNRVQLLGRLPGAPPRGCSLTVEEAAAPPPPPQTQRPEPRFARSPLPITRSTEEGDRRRVAQVMAALDSLRRLDVAPLAEGLTASVAQVGLAAALDAITADRLLQELSTPGRRPAHVSVVCAQGVFTAPVEWIAVYAAAGCSVLVKAPAEAPGFLYAVADAFTAAALAVQATISRDLGAPEAVVTFGADETLADVRSRWPTARHVGFGHRFSVAWVSDIADVPAMARDAAMYDSRGCMAPVAVFAPAGLAVATALAEEMAALARIMPRGDVAAGLGPEWRRRQGLARAQGRSWEGEDWAVLEMPLSGFAPAALPRMVVVHPVSSPDELISALSPWKHHLSTLAAADVSDPMLAAVREWFPRWCRPGEMQSPLLPRRHDGQRMLESVLLD